MHKQLVYGNKWHTGISKMKEQHSTNYYSPILIKAQQLKQRTKEDIEQKETPSKMMRKQEAKPIVKKRAKFQTSKNRFPKRKARRVLKRKLKVGRKFLSHLTSAPKRNVIENLNR